MDYSKERWMVNMMRIESIEKKKRETNIYTICLNNGQSYDIWDEMVVKYKLSLDAAIDESKLNEVINESQYYRGKDTALKYLRNKNRSIEEVAVYLKKKAFDSKTIDEVKDFLTENKIVNDEAFAQSYMLEALHKGYGSLRIRYDLEVKGVSESVIDQNIHQYLSREKEYEMACLAFETKLKGQILNEKNYAKAARFLASKGYEPDIINEVVSKRMDIDDI